MKLIAVLLVSAACMLGFLAATTLAKHFQMMVP
jgi:hypothetical protein